MDVIPGLSQIKSLVQLISGDEEAAIQTQNNFTRLCPVVSQIRSVVESAHGDEEAALETQVACGKFLLGVANGIPVVGHVKGVVHYAIGDKENGDLAMKSASHTSAVIGGGMVGMVVGGPVGSVAMGIGAGAAIDGTITAVDSAVKKKFSPFGALEVVKDPTNAGKWCDAVGGVALDGVLGRAAGGLVRAPKPATAGAAAADESAGAAVADESAVAGRSGINASRSGRLASTVRLYGRVVVKLYKNTVKLYNKYGKLIAIIMKEVGNSKIKFRRTPTADDNDNLTDKDYTYETSTYKISVKTVKGVKEVYLNDKLICVFFKEDLYIVMDGDLRKLEHELSYVLMNNGSIKEVATITSG